MQQSQKEIRLLGMADLESPRWEKQREASLARARGEARYKRAPSAAN